jgi:hypothetical protein
MLRGVGVSGSEKGLDSVCMVVPSLVNIGVYPSLCLDVSLCPSLCPSLCVSLDLSLIHYVDRRRYSGALLIAASDDTHLCPLR